MRILYAGYRPWARQAYRHILGEHQHRHQLHFVSDKEELRLALDNFEYDAVFLVGWSWIIPPEVCEHNYMVGVHPSDLPNYAGGTPLQHQILEGVLDSQCSLFRITPELDGGGIVGQAPLSLRGNMSDVFSSLADATVRLFSDFTHAWEVGGGPPPERMQVHTEPPRKRLKPRDSELTEHLFGKLNARQLYDFIRCREDPYPNVYVKDESGTLKFKLVDFEGPDDG